MKHILKIVGTSIYKSSIYLGWMLRNMVTSYIMCDLSALPSLASHTHFVRMRRGAHT